MLLTLVKTCDTIMAVDLDEIVGLVKTTCDDSECPVRYHYSIIFKSGHRIETTDEPIFSQLWFEKMGTELPKFSVAEA